MQYKKSRAAPYDRTAFPIFYLYFMYSINRLTAREAPLLFLTAKHMSLYAGTSSSFAATLYGMRRSMSRGSMLTPSPPSTMDIMA